MNEPSKASLEMATRVGWRAPASGEGMRLCGERDIARALDVFAAGTRKERDEAKAEAAKLREERDELRRICVAAVNATDGACGDTVSTEFLALLPREIEMLKAERNRLAQMLSNLLAVIHRDGGHYQMDHGLTKAVTDAESKVVEWLARDDEALTLAEAQG